MNFSVYVSFFTDKGYSNTKIERLNNTFDNFRDAFLCANTYSKKDLFEYFKICNSYNNNLIYYKDYKGIIQDNSK